jgi:3-deoxy-D-manno-octulosonate 8-phosphate phosphatase (KDO 8-P phosphatase)
VDSTLNKAQLSAVELVAFDFDGVFTDNMVYINEEGVESVRCWRSDGLGLSRLRSLGISMAIVSTEKNPVVTARAKKLNIPCKQGVEDKAQAIVSICKELDIDIKRAVFVGNDINDIPAFKLVGLPIAVNDSYPEVWPHISHRTKAMGGRGAVREVCDLIFMAKAENV